ncbi:MAG: phage tail assembly protein [Calditrichaeota bacterium]|nr:phage tail assembly protein [Calditrichota bacterium]MCB9088573.1 phage tail assembly protein [Calditrichia bacterium]MCB0288626.1 phage tail assembly protein [Calditrichota bacterium]MCB0294146.1 phage tail assembly protein [Calditrichota bacterium]MCB0302450.1 phage tail assembly protein [Calditrichota bacterium]
MAFQTEFEFTLPKGYVDSEGNLHKSGVMRLATAADEILPQKDARVHQNPAYLIVILLSRVINRLGDITNITPKTIEGLFSADLAFLQDFYQQINENETPGVAAVCPKCEHKFVVENHQLGEG